ncbi:hypothetical protein A2631_04705 [Candidatus Daviesbacteria bacterium RIFCSPHIGHO2_01_FULL_44_29]|uniref:Uncharacterized protein n=1 Tax=Candidatus Daviesbacteria bacterium RIFCSPHIGHO2_02_FULL_43_12 TaxID=1797776 RepID=A0A1F5KHD4_9BACT|nr:MAG: hypothetical protein A2631_04705 [Candidatus Daviesbacteria bacterium RIFCSPHIGHO2_01_FULL_44_29]OGE40021.1 MAG: hypothetical protein A3D25_04435 [Candidatus Daviesbacteria bacterium RIFCSPHIGHO2_02_FULL_43_12]OGE41496.1 MAG: hypothetical protein A3E86_05375 [Candidatus Daviesbacteria bacterium RIFCSPHIGHO2_12_FULL_47_45]OGE70298.1 MAG: hypothetical protein A3B55_01135 [Candidatus Daviesbacteria bacterium RIFCSPLOWO2_01_FULL_43_15]
MDQRRALMAIGGIIILLLAIVFGVAYFSSQNAKKPQVRKPTPSPSSAGSLTVPVASPEPGTDSSTQSPQNVVGTKTYTGEGFSLHYPEAWGLLKCNNTQNFEFDPTNPTEQLGVKCDYAVKPITFLVSNIQLSCTGETIQLGNLAVLRSKTTKANGDINYRWCVNGATASLDVTHRVSSTGSRATSKDDYSTQVEQMISSLSFGGGS